MNIKLNTYLKLTCLLIVCCVNSFSIKAENIFQIQDIEINIDTINSNNVRNIAIQNAERKGIEILAKKLLTTRDYNKFEQINEIDAKYLVEGIEFVNEIITSETYKAIFNIRYNSLRIREFFQAHNLVFTETKSNDIPLYAIFSNHEEFFNVDKAWRTMWGQRIGKHYALNMNYQEMTREKKNKLSLPSFLSLDFIRENDDFNSNNMVLIWCDPKIKGKRIELNIISKIIINNSTTIISNNFLEEFSINNAEYLEKIISTLEDNVYNHWVNSTSHSVDLQVHKFRFNFSSFNEWLAIKAILERINSISYYEIFEISNKKIEGNLYFHGNIEKLRLILNENNIYASDLGTIQIIQLKND